MSTRPDPFADLTRFMTTITATKLRLETELAKVLASTTAAMAAVTPWAFGPLPKESPDGRYRPSASQDRIGTAAGAGPATGAFSGPGTPPGAGPRLTVAPRRGCTCPQCTHDRSVAFLGSSPLVFGPVGPQPAPGQAAPRSASGLPALENYSSQDFDLTIEEVYGVRRWRFGPTGLLHPVAWPVAPWLPGVNEAVCHADLQSTPLLAVIDPTGRGRHATALSNTTMIEPVVPDPWIQAAEFTLNPLAPAITSRRIDCYRIAWNDGATETWPVRDVQFGPIPGHDVPHEWCTCGFYAYNTAASLGDYAAPIVGVVRLTGRVLVGSKGFRAQRGEIVALLNPSDVVNTRAETAYGATARALLDQSYPDVPILATKEEMVAEFPPSTID